MEDFNEKAADGTFLQDFEDFCRIWHNLAECVDFPDKYTGIRFENHWSEDKDTAGGTPTRGTQDQLDNWKKNTQYTLDINRKDGKETNLFISLGQVDGRLYFNENNPFPFKEKIRPIIVVVFRLEKGEDRLPDFNAKRIVKMSPIKQYRDLQIELNLPNGKYAIVPGTQVAGQENPYWLNLYFDCPYEELVLKNQSDGSKGNKIAEEEETDNTKYDDEE